MFAPLMIGFKSYGRYVYHSLADYAAVGSVQPEIAIK